MSVAFYQRKSSGDFYTTGKDFLIQTKVFYGHLDSESKDFYRNESAGLIAKKAAVLAFFAIPYTPGAALGNILLCLSGTKSFSKASYDIAKLPIFGPLLFLTSCYTTVFPLNGRKWIDWTERLWHEVDLSYDIRHGMSKRKTDGMSSSEFWRKIFQEEKILFAGYCMQRYGNLNDKINGKPKFVTLQG